MGHSVDSQVFQPLGHHEPNNMRSSGQDMSTTTKARWYEWKRGKSRDCKFAIL